MTNDSWQRLEKVINWSGLSTHSFAMHIGLKRSENLYRIKRGSNGISRSLANCITEVFPEINIDWLLSRSDEMFKQPQSCETSTQIPFYPNDIFSNTPLKLDSSPASYLSIQQFEDCDFATFVVGDSMSPIIPQGATVILKKCDINSLIPGKCYLISTNEMTCIRYVRSVENEPELLKLVPENKNSFDEFVINKDKIENIFSVKGVITTFAF
jgi:hypothetical protein